MWEMKARPYWPFCIKILFSLSRMTCTSHQLFWGGEERCYTVCTFHKVITRKSQRKFKSRCALVWVPPFHPSVFLSGYFCFLRKPLLVKRPRTSFLVREGGKIFRRRRYGHETTTFLLRHLTTATATATSTSTGGGWASSQKLFPLPSENLHTRTPTEREKSTDALSRKLEGGGWHLLDTWSGKMGRERERESGGKEPISFSLSPLRWGVWLKLPVFSPFSPSPSLSSSLPLSAQERGRERESFELTSCVSARVVCLPTTTLFCSLPPKNGDCQMRKLRAKIGTVISHPHGTYVLLYERKLPTVPVAHFWLSSVQKAE